MTTTTPALLLLLLLIAAAVILTPAAAQSPAAAPSPSSTLDCTSYLLNMSDCLSYVESGSNLTVPDAACCPELAGMLGTKPVCLCELLGSADSFGIDISLDKVMDLPSACRVSTPPVSAFCSASGYPIGGSPPTEAPKSPGDHPGTDGSNDSGSSSITVSQLFYNVGLAIATLSTFIWF